MEFKTNADIRDYFIKKIKSASQSELNKIIEETESLRQRKTKEIEDGAQQMADLMKDQQQKILRSEHLLSISNMSDKYNQQKIALREKMIAQLFDAIKKKLIEYSATVEYRESMKDKIIELSKKFDQDLSVRVSLKDKEMANDFQAVLKNEVEVIVDESIEIGGFVIEYHETSIIIDETLDSKLTDELSSFYENPQLVLF